MQAVHHKLDIVLVHILRYSCSETDYSLCEDSSPSRTPPSTRMWVSPSDPSAPHYFFSLRRPWWEHAQCMHSVAYVLMCMPIAHAVRHMVKAADWFADNSLEDPNLSVNVYSLI